MSPSLRPSLAVIGGSGFDTFLVGVEQVEMSTPYGTPPAPVAIGSVRERTVAFLPRHGLRHELPPLINSRADIWASCPLGVRRILDSCAVGALSTVFTPRRPGRA